MTGKVVPIGRTDCPAPPVLATLDARSIPTIPFDVDQLRRSGMGPLADGDAFRAYLMLLLAAFHEVPAGSLPNDDAALVGLVGLGRDLKTWARVREVALRGFLLCSDGRLYHRGVCRRAQESLKSSPESSTLGVSGKSGTIEPQGLDSPGQQFSFARPSPRRSPDAEHDPSPNAIRTVEPEPIDSPDTEQADTPETTDRSRGKRKKRKNPKNSVTTLREDWTLTDDEIRYGIAHGLTESEVHHEAEAMRIWAGSNSHRKETHKAGDKGWHLAFLGFLLRATKRKKERAAQAKTGRGFFPRASAAAKRMDGDGE